ncbi:hypothetical protein L1887_51338 [Cichorium endivia]|nr:hypothetical protein L1887_51338 [Cichorium endivia]
MDDAGLRVKRSELIGSVCQVDLVDRVMVQNSARTKAHGESGGAPKENALESRQSTLRCARSDCYSRSSILAIIMPTQRKTQTTLASQILLGTFILHGGILQQHDKTQRRSFKPTLPPP